ncbi:MAG: hypothetical protein EP343_21640 [Deltaproteobacteria bacterium]|nr:MAG: hypothetical protein EP343_21640 [Deltaproteobacteria bacterium]
MSEQRATIVAYIEKGLHCFSIGQFEEARSFWNKALELDPHNAQVQEFLQYVSPQASATPLSQPSAPAVSRVTPLPPTSPRPTTPPGGVPVTDGSDSRWGVWPPLQASTGPVAPSLDEVEEAWLPQEDDLPWEDSTTSPPRGNPGPRVPHPGPPSEEHPPFHRSGMPGSNSGQFPRYSQSGMHGRPAPGTGQFEAYRGQRPTGPRGYSGPTHSQHNMRGPQRHPSGMYPTPSGVHQHTPPSGIHQAPPSGIHPAPPSGFHPSSPSLHGRSAPSGVYPDNSSRRGGQKPDLSTRFLPSLNQRQVNPNELLQEGSSNQANIHDEWAAPADAFSEVPSSPSRVENSAMGSAPRTDSGRSKEDLSTRYLQTVSKKQQVAPEDLLGEAPASSTSLPGASTQSSASYVSVDEFSAQNVRGRDRSTRMISSVGTGNISPDELKDLIGEDTQDNPSPFADGTPDTPLSNDMHPAATGDSPSLLHIQAVTGSIGDRSTRNVPTIRSGAAPADLVPGLSPDDPTEVQPIPFGGEQNPIFGTSQASKSEDLSTRMFSPLPASPSQLLPEDDFLDVELFGEAGGEKQSAAPITQNPRNKRSMGTKDSAFFQEESLSTRLMEPVPPQQDHPTIPADNEQPANDLDFLLGNDSFSSLDVLPESNDEPIDVFSEDSIEVVFVSEEDKQQARVQSIEPMGSGSFTTLDRSSVPPSKPAITGDPWGEADTGEFEVPVSIGGPATSFETAETGEFDEPGKKSKQPIHVRKRQNAFTTADTGEFDEPREPVKVRQGRMPMQRAQTSEVTASQSPVFVEKGTRLEQPPVPSITESQRVPLDPDGPFEPMSAPPSAHHNAFTNDPATAETMLAGQAVSQTGPIAVQRKEDNVFEMPTSAQKDEPSLEDSGAGDDLGILLSGIEDLLAEEDFIGAKELLDVAVQQAPENPKIKILYQLCEKKVSEIFRQDFHSLDETPKIKINMGDILALRLNHRDGYILSQIDGMTSIADLLAISGFEEDELFMILGQLVHRGVIDMT